MAVTDGEIKALARLAKLEFGDERRSEFADEFEKILDFANTINSAVAGDTDTIRDVGGREIALENLREDITGESLPNEKITSNVTADGGYFTVKRVVK